MVSIRFTTLLLLVLILFLHLSDSMSTQAHEAIAKEQGNEVSGHEEEGRTRNIPINKIKEIHEVAQQKKLRLAMVGLRKMMLFKAEYSSSMLKANDHDEKEKGSKLSKKFTSGAASYVGKRNINVKSKRSSTSTNKCSRFDHDENYSRWDDHDHVKFTGSKLIDEGDDDEIVNMMNKDYQGNGNPRHGKPPINNNLPLLDRQQHQIMP